MNHPREKKSRYYWGQRKTSAVFAEAVAVAHFLVANLVMLIGQYFPVFDFLESKNGGVKFVYHYIDFPLYTLLGSLTDNIGPRGTSAMFGCELIILASSAVYGVICYFLLDLLFSVLKLGR